MTVLLIRNARCQSHADDLVVVLAPSQAEDLVVPAPSHADDFAPQASEDAPRPKAAVAAIVKVAMVTLRMRLLRMRVPCLQSSGRPCVGHSLIMPVIGGNGIR